MRFSLAKMNKEELTLKIEEESRRIKDELALKIQDSMNQILVALQSVGKAKGIYNGVNEEVGQSAGHSTASIGGRGWLDTPPGGNSNPQMQLKGQ